MKLSDFIGLFKKTIGTVENIENPGGNYHIINLKVKEGLTWKPGEHGIFTLPDDHVYGKGWRAFSITSIPEEGVMKIATRKREPVSSFKSNLLRMKEGDRVKIRGPFGWFKLQDEESPLVLIASGIGITPIRALLKELEKGNNRKVHVVYASKDFFLFEEDIREIASKDPNIMLHFMRHRLETQQKISELADFLENDAYYYISGSPQIIKSVSKLLKSKNIKASSIINDPFIGY